MEMRGEKIRFWLPVVGLLLFSSYTTFTLVRAHLVPQVDSPDYIFERKLPAKRGSIYSAVNRGCPFAKSVPFWEYRLDPVALTNCVVRRRKEPPRSRKAIVKTIADFLGLNYNRVLSMATSEHKKGYRNQFLSLSADPDAYKILADHNLVAGIKIQDQQVRQYLNGRRLSHVIGSVSAENYGQSGIELRYNRILTGLPGMIRGMRDAKGNELYDKRKISTQPVPGSDVYLTIDPQIQVEAEDALKWGLAEFGAASGWFIVMESDTGAVRAMGSLPDFEPLNFGHVPDDTKINRAIGFVYEPGSVMKVITAAAAIDAGFASPNTIYNTRRDDPRYYKLPGDGSHVWEPTMTIRDAIVHSSNIVIGKLGYDFGHRRLYDYMRKFGFGQLTGIELPGEQYGILPKPNDMRLWNKASQSRAAIGQFIAVTGIQLVSAYQAIANDGLRMKPYIVDHITDHKGVVTSKHEPTPIGRPISVKTARTMRDIMKDVASPKGTARRAAIRGYSVAGKTGTAQKAKNGRYQDGLYRASFCGIVPAESPKLVILVTLDFESRTKFHQGGNSAGPVFRRIAMASLRYMSIPPDKPDELEDSDVEDEFDRVIDSRAAKYDIILGN